MSKIVVYFTFVLNVRNSAPHFPILNMHSEVVKIVIEFVFFFWRDALAKYRNDPRTINRGYALGRRKVMEE